MKNDTAVSLLVASLVIALVCVPVMADIAPPTVCRIDTSVDAAKCPDDICLYYNTTCVNETRMAYPQEYYTLSALSDKVYSYISTERPTGNAVGTYAEQLSAMELRRQTILMEKQNELLAEQNELMGRLVNATEIKFECKATGYVQQASYWNLDEPEVNASDYHYNVNPADVVQCANLSYFERANYGCHS